MAHVSVCDRGEPLLSISWSKVSRLYFLCAELSAMVWGPCEPSREGVWLDAGILFCGGGTASRVGMAAVEARATRLGAIGLSADSATGPHSRIQPALLSLPSAVDRGAMTYRPRRLQHAEIGHACRLLGRARS